MIFYKAVSDFRFLLLKQYDDSGSALKDLYKIIGKMCHKSIESKYFLNRKEECNRIKSVDFKAETMVFDHEDEKLAERFESFKVFVNTMRKRLR